MIRYALVCEHDHDFEGWFRDSATCDEQLSRNAVECPYCGSHAITKALMAPNVVSSRSKENRLALGPDPAESGTPTPDQDAESDTESDAESARGSAPPPSPSGPPSAPLVPALPLGQNARPMSVASGPEGKDAITKLAQAMAQMRAHVEATCEDVGRDFAEEARKIHHGETDDRPIHGEATLEEAKALTEEGIGVSLLPWHRRFQN